MGWIDEARRKREKRAREQRAAEEAKRAVEAKARAIEAARQAKESNKFAREVKRLLPRGVELAGVFADREGPAARVHLGTGEQFDLVPTSRGDGCDSRGNVFSYHSRNWRGGGSRSIEAFEAKSDYSFTYWLASTSAPNEWMWKPRFSKAQMEELLLEAWEKHNTKQQTG